MADDYTIKITTQGDPRGADKVTESVDKVTKATKQNAQESRTLMNDLANLGARKNAPKDVVEGLELRQVPILSLKLRLHEGVSQNFRFNVGKSQT